MSAEQGRVSVVVTTRNSGDTLENCLASIRAQTYRDLELIVVDNASRDTTREIAERYADQVLDAGPERSAQRNRGVSASAGVWVLIIDSDMVLTPTVVEECVHTAEAQGAAAVVIPERSVGVGFLARAKALERSCYIGDDSVEAARFFRRSAYERYGGYDERLTGPEDWDLPARMRGAERFARVDAMIVHDEGHLRLVPHLRKKFYYGRSASAYVLRHRGLAARQVTPLRASFVRNWRTLGAQPVLTVAMLALKTAELTAGGMGVACEAVASRRRRV